ncbi:MAG: DUF5131 family protein, partial [Acidobacteriota bacterium]
ATIRFLCCEPLLGPLELSSYFNNETGAIDWVTVGAETGYHARPMDEDWVRGVRDQCIAAKVRFSYRRRSAQYQSAADPALDGVVWDQMPECKVKAIPNSYQKKRNKTIESNQLSFDFG